MSSPSSHSSSSSLSGGSHNITPPTSSITYEPSSPSYFKDKLSHAVGGAFQEIKGALRGRGDEVDEGRRERQEAGKGKGAEDVQQLKDDREGGGCA
jgi:hypothetical protein